VPSLPEMHLRFVLKAIGRLLRVGYHAKIIIDLGHAKQQINLTNVHSVNFCSGIKNIISCSNGTNKQLAHRFRGL